VEYPTHHEPAYMQQQRAQKEGCSLNKSYQLKFAIWTDTSNFSCKRRTSNLHQDYNCVLLNNQVKDIVPNLLARISN
jgi:hypothetical protein